MEGTVDVVDPGLDEIRQHLIAVGGADQPAQGQAHVLGVPGGQNIAEVAGGHADVQPFVRAEPAFVHQVGPGGKIVGHLGDEPADVDAVGGGKDDVPFAQLLRKGGIVEDGFYAGLRVVKVAADGDDVGVLPGGGDHLLLLELADPVQRIKHRAAGAGDVGKALQGGLARIPAGGGQDGDFPGFSQRLRCQQGQPGQHLQGQVLEGQRRPVIELQQGGLVVQHMDRCDGRGVKTPVGFLGDPVQAVARKVREKEPQHLGGPLGVADILAERQHIRRSLRKLLRHVKTARGAQAPENRPGGRYFFLGPSADVAHGKTCLS